MKIKRFTLLTLPVFALAIGIIALSNSKEAKYFPREYGESASTSAQGFLEYMRSIKANPLTGEIDPKDVLAAKKQVGMMPKAKASLGLAWQFKGPDNIGGRTRALLIDKNNPDHIYAGGVAGGMFESFNGAQSWQPYDPDFEEVNMISSITQGVDGSVYIGTGGHFENAFNSKEKGYFFIGSGVHKLLGDGNYETIVAPAYRTDATIDYATIGEVAASKVNKDILWVAMNNGFRKIDMANDTIEIPIVSTQRCDDIKVSEGDSVIVVTFGRKPGSNAGGKIFVSHDGGATFTETTPSGTFRRIEVAIAPSNKNIIYAAAAKNNGCLANIYRSRDAGLTWEIIGPGGALNFDMFAQPSGGSSCQGDWDNMIKVFPDDPGKIIVGGITLYRWVQSSVDPEPANGLWTRLDVIGQFSENVNPLYVHADKHAMSFDPRNSDVAYIATDGGITKSTNMNDELPSYTASNYKYGVTQFYGMDVNGQGTILGGTQDNGSLLAGLKFNNNLGALLALGGDGFDAGLSNIDTSVGVATSQFNNLRRVQGIGTSSGNSNLSTADITSSNLHMSGYCETDTGCTQVFYTAIELWESFDHDGSTDSVGISSTILDDQLEESLPPIPLNTSIPFESNNNARIIQEAIVDTSWSSVTTFMLNATQIDSVRSGIYPLDTISATSGRFDTLYLRSNTTAVFNFDTISVDTIANTLTINRRGDGGNSLSIPYSMGAEATYNNILLGSAEDIRFQVDIFDFGSRNGEPFLLVEEMNIRFRYSFKVQDRVQSILASANWPGRGVSNPYDQKNVFITRDLLKGNTDIVWHLVAGALSTPNPITSTVVDMKFTPDGDHLFIGTQDGGLYRVSGLNDSVKTGLPQSSAANYDDIINNKLNGKCHRIGNFNGAVTDIAIYPNNPDLVLVSIANYGNHNKIARYTNATTVLNPTGNFDYIQGSGNTALPLSPAYAVMVDYRDSNKVLIGNDFGVFATENAFDPDPSLVQWSEENTGLGQVPVFEIRQIQEYYPHVKNSGAVYIATHGRGVYRADQLVGIDDKGNNELVENKAFKSSMKMFPNPVEHFASIEFKIEDVNSAVLVEVYNIRGQKVKVEQLDQLVSGKNTKRLNFSDLDRGTYIIRAIHQNQVFSSKFIKQ